MRPYSEVVPKLVRRRPHVVWLDYDEPLEGSMLEDCSGTLSTLAPGSVFIVTVTAQLGEVERARSMDEQQARKTTLAAEYNQSFGRLLSEPVTPRHLSRRNLPVMFSEILRRQCIEAVRSRRNKELDFLQLFNFRYADSATMLTFGGLIDSPERIDDLLTAGFVREPYIGAGADPLEISVPHLTLREKSWLDQHLKRIDRKPDKVVFELDGEAVGNYHKFYKYYPTYYETLI